MRPRRMAAENASSGSASALRRTRFNEAAAHGRGKCTGFSAIGGRRRSFNEAAAHGRGKFHLVRFATWRRPRFNEAAAHGRGKCPSRFGDVPLPFASMRPRRMAAENAEKRAAMREAGELQ